jgi:hypothetical protein
VADRMAKALTEVTGLLRAPQRAVSLVQRLAHDRLSIAFESRHLYSHITVTRPSPDALRLLIRWILDAERSEGGIAAYYSLLRGYAEAYPEVTGYIVPTLYDFARLTGNEAAHNAAERATHWLLSLQMLTGAFPGGLYGGEAEVSVFNTGQILQGLVRAWGETNRADIRDAALAAGDWLVRVQQADGSWSGPGAYQRVAHTYYSMVAWALA